MKPSRFSKVARAALFGLLAAQQTACSSKDDASNQCDAEEGSAGAAATSDAEGVTSTEIVPDLTLAEFKEMCKEACGIVETHSVCGGVVSGPGFSYDDATYELTEHTCAGYNTCSGFSCVIDG